MQMVTSTDAGYDEDRALFNSMIDKRPAVIAKCATPDDVVDGARARRQGGLRHRRAGRRPLRGRHVDQRRRHRDRRAPDEVDRGRCVGHDGPGRRRRHLERVRPTPPRSMGSPRRAAGSRRPASPGSPWAAGQGGSNASTAWPATTWSPSTSSDRRRAEGHRERGRERRAVLGPARRGRQLRRGDVVHVPPVPPRPEVLAGLLFWPGAAGFEVGRAYRDLVSTAPDELGSGLVFLTGPAEEFMPAHLQGTTVAAVAVLWAGEVVDGEEAIAPLRALAPEVDLAGPMPYTDFQCMIDDPPGQRNYWTRRLPRRLP